MINQRLLTKYLRVSGAASACILVFTLFASANAAVIYSNGFETDISGWFTPTRVASGTGGITSAAGAWHATTGTDFTRWGGYSSVFPAGGYVTSIDIYLDVGGGWTDNTRFDFSSAINGQDGAHLRDFIFNGAFFSSADNDGPGAGLDRFIFSASNNTQPGSAFAKNPARSPISIATTGWYTFQHMFYENGSGDLAVDMSIFDSANNLMGTWTLSDTADDIATVVGGNRYGWFNYNEFGVLAIDNAILTAEVVPIPASAWFFGSAIGLLGWIRRKTALPLSTDEHHSLLPQN